MTIAVFRPRHADVAFIDPVEGFLDGLKKHKKQNIVIIDETLKQLDKIEQALPAPEQQKPLERVAYQPTRDVAAELQNLSNWYAHARMQDLEHRLRGFDRVRAMTERLRELLKELRDEEELILLLANMD